MRAPGNRHGSLTSQSDIEPGDGAPVLGAPFCPGTFRMEDLKWLAIIFGLSLLSLLYVRLLTGAGEEAGS
jgi:hypothetical protein